MRYDITSALSVLAPNASFAVIGNTYEGIDWSETNSQTKPTKEEVTSKINELNKARFKKEKAEASKNGQLDFVFDGKVYPTGMTPAKVKKMEEDRKKANAEKMKEWKHPR